jgi:hypothetical protein
MVSVVRTTSPQFFALLALALWLLPGTQAAAQEPSTAPEASAEAMEGPPAVVNYLANRLDTNGIAKVSAKNQRGLDVEIAARRHGVDSLASELSRLCKSSALSPDWKQGMRSMGSEIYADRTFRILLSGRLSDVIIAARQVSRTPMTAQDGQDLAFRIPAAIPLELTQCGAVDFFPIAGVKLRVFPTPDAEAAAGGRTVVTLGFEQGRAAFVPRDREAAKILESSSLAAAGPAVPSQVVQLPLMPQ